MIVRDLQLTPHQERNIRALGRRVIPRAEFLHDLKCALREKRGYAVGRLGMSQKHWMYYPILKLRGAANPKIYKLFETRLNTHGLKHEGIFPADPAFYLRFNAFYVEHVRNLDCIGLYFNAWDMALEKPILDFYALTNKLIHYVDLQPDRRVPTDRPRRTELGRPVGGDEPDCYLPEFRDHKILLISPFASLLHSRATETIFEGVWSKLGKRWFHPKSVEALDIPYGFAAETHARYPTAFELFDDIVSQIEGRDFDVALIGAGGLAIPIASHIKNLGKLGLDIGGHLQIIFGVIGKKWRGLEDWRAAYFNEWWIDMPAAYKPKEDDVCPENGEPGAYW